MGWNGVRWENKRGEDESVVDRFEGTNLAISS